MIEMSRSFAYALMLGLATLTVACGENASPAAPSAFTPLASAGGATIQGQVNSGSTAAPLLTSAQVPSGMTVEAVGRGVSGPVDNAGRFTLENVPPGPVRLRFVGSGVDALLDIGPVQSGQIVTLIVSVSGSSAQLESETSTDEDVHPAGVVAGLGGSCPELTFMVNGTLVRTSAQTVFDDGGCQALADGDDVRVDGIPQPDGSVLATEVEVDEPAVGGPKDDDPDGADNADDGEVHPEGFLSALSGGCPFLTFVVDDRLLGPVTVTTTGSTVFDDGGCPALAKGDFVRVDAVREAGTVRATEVEVDELDDADDDSDDDSTDDDSDDDSTDDDSDDDSTDDDSDDDSADDDSDDDDSPVAVSLQLRIDPDEWRLDWGQGSQSGDGGANLRIRIDGSGSGRVDPDRVSLSGPNGSIGPVEVDPDDDRFEAEFSKISAIALVGDVTIGDLIDIDVTLQLRDEAFPRTLTREVSIRE